MRIALLLTVVLSAGCGDPFSNRLFEEDTLFVEALPDAAELRSEAPEADDAEVRELGQRAAAVTLTRSISGVVNGLNRWLLNTLDHIVDQPITTREDDARIWGPYDWPERDDAVVRLVVERIESGEFTYRLEGARTGDAPEFARLLEGSFSRLGDLREGNGVFTYYADAVANLIEDGGGGTMTSEYTARPGGVTLYSEFDQWIEADGSIRDWDYYFEVQRGAGGLFEFRTPAEVTGGEGSAPEVWHIRSRWGADRVGRADAIATGGDTTGRTPSVECWDADLDRIYFRLGSATSPAVEEGTEDDCGLGIEEPRDLRD